MSNVIDFLERMGRDAHLRHATAAEVKKVLAQEEIDPAVQAAILSEDQSRLEALLGAATNVCCMVHHPGDDDDDDAEDDDDDDDDLDDEDDEDDELKSQQAVADRAAAAR